MRAVAATDVIDARGVSPSRAPLQTGGALRAEDDTDEALIARAGRGDRLAASRLVLRHTDRIFAASWRILGDRASAEDATQETFLKLWTAAPNWRRDGASLKTWLYKVSMNACIDRLRKRGREAPESAAPETADRAPSADEAMIAEQRAQAIDAALAALPERQRLAVTLCHYEELSNIEAASVLGISVEAVESLLGRARRALRASLLDVAGREKGAAHDRAAV
jgi:RNA polymerase sigma-70 factor (ECF subfamily)